MSKRIITLEEGWKQIHQDGILKLQRMIQSSDLKKRLTNDEYMAIYGVCYDMCIQKSPHCYAAPLYERYGETFTQYLNGEALPAINAQSGQFMVKELVKRWEDHELMIELMWGIFRYIDKFYVLRNCKTPLREVGLNRFRSLIFERTKTQATASILDLILMDRKEEVGIEIRDLLRSAIQIYVKMDEEASIYRDEFEGKFIEATKDFYSAEASHWQSQSCPEYLRAAEQAIRNEKLRLRNFLHASTEEKLMEAIYDTILVKQQHVLDHQTSGCKIMLENHSEQDLARMFALYSNVPDSLPPIADIFKRHIVEVGNGFLAGVKAKEEKSKHLYIEQLMRTHDTYLALVTTCFREHAVFHKALKEAFETIVNQRVAGNLATAELLSDYADLVLKKGGLRLTEQKLRETLDNIVRLFTYLSDKDMFSEFYRKQLAKRLLLQRSASDEDEKAMIGKLKMRCGAQFTSKLEGMINDIRNGDEHRDGFQEHLQQGNADLGCEFSVTILTTGFWPSYNKEEIKLPIEMKTCLDTFKDYYMSKTNNRQIAWMHQLGTVTVTGHFDRRRVDLIVSTLQAAILLLFNQRESYTIQDMITKLGISPEMMKANLRTFVSNKKTMVLRKVPEKGYALAHSIRVNTRFASQQYRIRVPNAIMKTNQKERNKAHEIIEQDRKHTIEANIVRVMKARKTLTHQQLMQEVTSQLLKFFKPDPRQIKRRIEDLISRDYLDRDEEQNNLYHYVA